MKGAAKRKAKKEFAPDVAPAPVLSAAQLERESRRRALIDASPIKDESVKATIVNGLIAAEALVTGVIAKIDAGTSTAEDHRAMAAALASVKRFIDQLQVTNQKPSSADIKARLGAL